MIIERMKPTADQIQKKNVYVVKVVTTGLGADDEILELCVLDARSPYKPGTREVAPLYHGRFRPEYRQSWPEASKVNGITPAMVAREPLLSDVRGDLLPLFTDCDCVVAFNADFDFAFLRRQFMFRANVMVVDLMRDWTAHVEGDTPGDKAGAGSGVSPSLPFVTQSALFEHFGWTAERGTVSDCLGLRHCFLKMIPTGCIHVRQPLLDRRFARTAATALEEVQEGLRRALAEAGLPGPVTPYLEFEERENYQVVLRVGVRDPERLLFAEEPVLDEFAVPFGSPSEVREKALAHYEAAGDLPSGLRDLVCRLFRGEEERPVGTPFRRDDDTEEAAQDGEATPENAR